MVEVDTTSMKCLPRRFCLTDLQALSPLIYTGYFYQGGTKRVLEQRRTCTELIFKFVRQTSLDSYHSYQPLTHSFRGPLIWVGEKGELNDLFVCVFDL